VIAARALLDLTQIAESIIENRKGNAKLRDVPAKSRFE